MTDNYDEAQFQRVYAEYIQTTNRLSEENDVLMLAAVKILYLIIAQKE